MTTTHQLNTLGNYEYAITFARYNAAWLFVRHKARTTWELPGGHIEPGESALQAIERELYEETGAVKFELTPLFDITVSGGDWSRNGQIFFAEIEKLGEKPESEIAEIRAFERSPTEFPDALTYAEDMFTIYPKAMQLIEEK